MRFVANRKNKTNFSSHHSNAVSCDQLFVLFSQNNILTPTLRQIFFTGILSNYEILSTLFLFTSSQVILYNHSYFSVAQQCVIHNTINKHLALKA